MVPGLVILTGDDADIARGTSLLVIILTALTATVTNVRNGLVDVRIAAASQAWSAFRPVWWGRPWASGCPSRLALVLFAGLLAWSGIQMILRSRHSRGEASTAAARDT